MKSLRRLIKQFRMICESLYASSSLYHIQDTKKNNFFAENQLGIIEKNHTPQDHFDHVTLSCLQKLQIGKAHSYSHEELRTIAINTVFYPFNYFIFTTDEQHSTVIYDNKHSISFIENMLSRLNPLYEKLFHSTLYIERADDSHLRQLERRIKEAEEYYLNIHGPWTERFIENLGDDISRLSFRHFLSQRIRAHILWDSPAMCPIEPPEQTREWREARCASPPPLPLMGGCTKWQQDFFHLHSFIYEQYSILGLVEAMPGDTVIDAGAYIGDTALYFSQKVGAAGRVYGFEAIPASVAQAEENMRVNGCDNVEMLCLALAERKRALRFSLNADDPSSSYCDANGCLELQAISLDEFADERKIQAGFLKADIEGGEMDMLRGARECIRAHAPACGIALYHRQADYHEIPQYLHSLRPDYRFFFRCEAEPVLFAKKL